jgi:predicted Zn-dependent protease
MGEWDGSRGRIRIRDGMPADVTATILLHELGHAVSSNKGLVDGMTEEAFVIGSWENGLSQLIRDNPGLMPWVAKQFR